MKKILLLTFFMFVLQMFVFSNDFNFNNTYFFPTDELVNSPQLQLLQINNRLKIIQYNIDKLYWRPNVSLSLDPSFNMSGLDSYSLGLSNSISLSQKLPMKTNLSLSVSQPLSFKLPNGDNSYRFSFSTNLNISTSLFNKEIRNNFSNIEKKYLDNLFQEVTLKYAISKMEFEENILTIVGMYLYYKTLINIYSERKGLLEKKSQDDFLLYSEGHITSVEYAERENVKMQNAANFLKYYEQMFLYETKLIAEGISSEVLNLTFEKFVTDLKKYIVKNHHSSQYQKEYELLQIESLWKLTLEQYISVFPNLNISFALNPEASTNYNPYEYWKTLNSVDWSLSFSTGISFSTRKSLFSTANEYKLEKEKFKVQYNQTREAMKNEVIIREKKMELYTFLEEQNSQLFYAELKRTEQFESLYLLGRITEYEFNIQRFIKEEAYINWYFSKLNKELFLLSCY